MTDPGTAKINHCSHLVLASAMAMLNNNVPAVVGALGVALAEILGRVPERAVIDTLENIRKASIAMRKMDHEPPDDEGGGGHAHH